jgi:hypothetical protein
MSEAIDAQETIGADAVCAAMRDMGVIISVEMALRITRAVLAAVAPAIRAAVLEEGFDLGFSATGEGWNAEYPEGLMETANYRARRFEVIRALAARGEADHD